MTARPKYIDDARFNQTFELPADPAKGRVGPFKVTYADYGYRNKTHPEQENVLLFFAPMMGSRLLHIAKDDIARKHKIRIISPDRPGFGGTDVVDQKVRMSFWREVIAALLRHLEIEHVSVASHSGGTIYALDFVLNHPEALHLERPYLAIGAPWILPSHTTSATMRMAQLLPASIIDHTDKLASLINNYINPALATSVGLSQPVIHKLKPARPESASDVRDGEDNDDTRFEEELFQDIISRIYTEGAKGISDEAVVLMQKNGSVWGSWGDYDTLVPRLEQALRTAGRKLSIDVFFAENDFMVGDGGTKGPLWFDQCWGLQHEDGAINYRSTIVKGADHNEIWNLRWGVAQAVLNRISPSVPDSSS